MRLSIPFFALPDEFHEVQPEGLNEGSPVHLHQETDGPGLAPGDGAEDSSGGTFLRPVRLCAVGHYL